MNISLIYMNTQYKHRSVWLVCDRTCQGSSDCALVQRNSLSSIIERLQGNHVVRARLWERDRDGEIKRNVQSHNTTFNFFHSDGEAVRAVSSRCYGCRFLPSFSSDTLLKHMKAADGCHDAMTGDIWADCHAAVCPATAHHCSSPLMWWCCMFSPCGAKYSHQLNKHVCSAPQTPHHMN